MAVLLAFGSLGVADETAGATSEVIAENEIGALQKNLAEAGEASSSTRKRRAYKNVVRDGEKLIETLPAAANRWRVLEIMFQKIENSLAALEKGDLDEAVRLLSGPAPTPERPNPDEWTAPRLHGRAIAHIGMKNWDAALADLDAAIVAHQWAFNSKRPCPCQQVARLRHTR